MISLGDWRSPVGFWLWVGITYIIILMPLHVGWIDWAFFGADYDLSEILHTVTVLYAALAISASTVPSTVNWALHSGGPARSPVIALAALGSLFFGLIFLSYLVGKATSDATLTEGVELTTRQGVSLSLVLVLSMVGCTAIQAAAAKRGI